MEVNKKFILKENVNLQNIIDNLITKDKSNPNLKCLKDILKGKQGRLRENLLGKTVDYSARSVITVEPKLELKECGIPEEIVKNLFQNILIKKLIQLKMSISIKSSKKLIKEKSNIIQYIIKKTVEKVRFSINIK